MNGNDYQQLAQAQASIGYGQIQQTTRAFAVNQVKETPLLEAHAGRISSNAEDVEQLAQRLHRLADRVFGSQAMSVKEAKECTGPVPPPSHAMGKLSDAHAWNDRALATLRNAVERLDVL